MHPQIAWPLLGNFSCPQTTTSAPCPRSENMGWRYFLFTMGGLMLLLWVLRFFVFTLYESPKYLMGRGRDADAVAAVHKVAAYNGRTSGLSVEHLRAVDAEFAVQALDTSAKAVAARKMEKFNGGHVKALFATRKLAWSTSLLLTLWGE